MGGVDKEGMVWGIEGLVMGYGGAGKGVWRDCKGVKRGM